MALTTHREALRPRPSAVSPSPAEPDQGDAFDLNDFEEELKRLSAINQELLSEAHTDAEEPPSVRAVAEPLPDAEDVAMLRQEVAILRARVQELESLAQAPASSEDDWLERQREYEMLLEEKSEVIRGLHQKMQEMQNQPSSMDDAPAARAGGQAEEILRLKRELDEQRKQMEQDEEDMMSQLRQMEMTMAKERAEMARQRQEVTRMQADIAREIEMASRNPELRERLHNLRRPDSSKSHATLPNIAAQQTPLPQPQERSSGFLRRIFG